MFVHLYFNGTHQKNTIINVLTIKHHISGGGISGKSICGICGISILHIITSPLTSISNAWSVQGELEKIRVWFQDYKVPDGKPKNKFGLGNKAADKVFIDFRVSSVCIKCAIYHLYPYAIPYIASLEFCDTREFHS